MPLYSIKTESFMTRNLLQKLKKLAEDASPASYAAAKTATLSQALYPQPSDYNDLNHSYQELKDRFGLMSDQLQDQNNELIKKIAQLDTMSQYLHSILFSISQGIVFVRFNGIITTFNAAAEKILEKDRLDVLFSSFWDHFPDNTFGFSMKHTLDNKEAPNNLFINLETPSGIIRELELQTHLLIQGVEGYETTDPDNIEVTQGLIITIRDYTETNRLRRLANRNDRMKELGEMAAMVAHEIRNPLGGIKGFAGLLERDLKDQPALAKIARQVVEGADHLNRLVTEVLHYSRPVDIQFETLDPLSILKDIRQHFQAEHPNSSIQFEILEPSQPLLIPVDRYKIRAAVLNMVKNACDAMPDGGKLTLSVAEEQGEALITIEDTGIGIPAENLEKIFSPFFTTKTHGNGFGLSEAHKIIQAHEGTIEVKSQVGAGSIFIIRLPVKTFARNL
jgi:signal transduction histidine kinase